MKRKITCLRKDDNGGWEIHFAYYDEDGKYTGDWERGLIPETAFYDLLKPVLQQMPNDN